MELEGIEPSSKQGRPVLSTRLSQTGFSCSGRTWATSPEPYPLKGFIGGAGPLPTISDIAVPLGLGASERELQSDISFQHLVPK